MIIRPLSGRVINTDRETKYPDASDHNMVEAKLRIGDDTTARAGTLNVRRYAFDLGTKYDWNDYRDSRCARLIADSGVSVLALQECEKEQDAYLAKKLPELTGVPWQAVSAPTNVGIMFKSDRWNLLATKTLIMDNGDEPDRRLVLALLESVKTGRSVWFGSTHFGVGLALAERRRYQAKRVCEYLKNFPDSALGDQRSASVIMGDFNDWADWKHLGVRQVFAQYGFRELRDRLSDAAFTGDTVSTKHKFGGLTPRDGRQIDAIFTYQ
jgi:endonuclease/exonuclease/phosphatase family metal-dependent hydrolase